MKIAIVLSAVPLLASAAVLKPRQGPFPDGKIPPAVLEALANKQTLKFAGAEPLKPQIRSTATRTLAKFGRKSLAFQAMYRELHWASLIQE
jgi:hypothetical protein